MKKNNLIIIFVIAILIIGGGSYYLGKKMSSPASNKIAAAAFQANGQGARRIGAGGVNRNAANLVNGDIIKKDNTSITVSLRDGGSRTIYFTASTTISKITEGTPEDLVAGKSVVVSGTPNTDNSLSAQTIQIRTASSTNFMMGGVNGGRQQ